ncbi:hypothetical protein ATANTOWER_015573 [Ataeniobius toweri]|uniref:Uncharacterized protein n=1 Tax=Ataeniobius toweri TaxID=208326 RepID=A0ABU7A6Y1_9TELE|nr:hypothetical protein [Ataeniobius toweri]
MPSLLHISKVQFIHEEWSHLCTGGREIAFFFDLQPRLILLLVNDECLAHKNAQKRSKTHKLQKKPNTKPV